MDQLVQQYRWILLFVASFTGFLLARPSEAKALGFGCAGVAGEVLFLDTLYGTATGLVVSGVLEAIRDDHSDWDKRIATGSALGAGVGLALGVLEITLRNCDEPSRANHTMNSKPQHRNSMAFMPRMKIATAPTHLAKNATTHPAAQSFAEPQTGLALEWTYRLGL